ncbi:class I SAM-dependent methyltransferase [Nocardia otitidiscaviarum]|uniref:S-adenosyl-L-methionine-dependent methyltransferase n=1 Tax=Nocardia otitidiscaviarum TaxID=1823 RepID=A0A516NJ70_9NOCA|nr:class I SAM-dependent methyltransferase [Nocardia otitidiscaviarum]MCP9619601.1 class I SAM-dependent methyltransferase [Nocardia otitidiscaviarum]QDP78953.1 class I SAM-dependent methyltransferase [Nocardia otitidiscaviarum]
MRTDDDNWDITESVGATALGVAAMRAAESRRPDALFHDPYAEVLVTAVDSPVWQRMGRGDYEESVAEALTQLWSFVVARTLYFDEYFRAAADAGIRQFVIVAAGLDARAYRLEYPAGTTVFEIDQPKVLEFKAKTLAAYDGELTVRRRTVAADLRQDWPKALRDSGFDPDLPTAWLAEGLLRYLPADAQDRLLGDIVALSAPGSRVALNMSGERSERAYALDRERTRFMAEQGVHVDVHQLWYPFEGRNHPVDWFRQRGWVVTPGDPREVLTRHGRDVDSELTADEMARHILMTAIHP